MPRDIKTAFLSGDGEHRNISILRPDDVRDILKLSPESMLRLRKAVCGLVNAPKKWWDRLKRSPLNQKQIRGVTRVHVNDLLGGSDEVLDRKILEVKGEFDFGAWDVGAMRFKERQLKQMANYEIMIDMEHYKHTYLLSKLLTSSTCAVQERWQKRDPEQVSTNKRQVPSSTHGLN